MIEELPAWTIEPNWGGGVLERLEWLTDVMQSPSGAEQRRSLRASPRRAIEFEVLRTGTRRALLDNYLTAYGSSDWWVPVWHDRAVLAAPLSAGAAEIGIDVLWREFLAGGVAILIGETPFDYELVEIVGILGGKITLAAPLAKDWPAGTRLYPVRKARLDADQHVDLLTSDAAVMQVRANVAEASLWKQKGGYGLSYGYSYGATALGRLPQYEGRPVYLAEPNRVRDLGREYDRLLHVIDSDVGLVRQTDTAQRALPVYEYTWFLRDRAAQIEFRDLLYQLRGRARAMWLPTFAEDFHLAAETDGVSATCDVFRTGYADCGGPRAGRERVCVETYGGEVHFRKIVSAETVSATVDRLTLDSALPALALSDVRRISFIDLMRLDQDVIEIDHPVDAAGVATVSAAFRATAETREAEDWERPPLPLTEMTSGGCGSGPCGGGNEIVFIGMVLNLETFAYAVRPIELLTPPPNVSIVQTPTGFNVVCNAGDTSAIFALVPADPVPTGGDPFTFQFDVDLTIVQGSGWGSEGTGGGSITVSGQFAYNGTGAFGDHLGSSLPFFNASVIAGTAIGAAGKDYNSAVPETETVFYAYDLFGSVGYEINPSKVTIKIVSSASDTRLYINNALKGIFETVGGAGDIGTFTPMFQFQLARQMGFNGKFTAAISNIQFSKG